MKWLMPILGLLLIGLSTMAAASDGTIGIVKTMKGEAWIVRNGENLPANQGDHVRENDTLETGPKSSLGIILKDNSMLSMGSDTCLKMNRYVFNPAQKKYSMITKIKRGTIAYLSGLMVKLSIKSVQLQTSTAVAGVRGTKLVIKVEAD